ncbi:hypothetical protein [Rhodococcus kronopolitis]|uniref:Uncharacterized protein n=1 Tax=Rhodococcus kronopolitis TaxID=1460226 RepID=A0ABV9FMJ7_9NOCA
MATSTTIWIVVAAVAVIAILAALAWVARNKRNEHRHVEAEEIRTQAGEESLRVGQREALADETAAKARAAQAEAEAKAAEAEGLEQRAAAHRIEATDSRDELNQQLDRADTIDPASTTPEAPRPGGHREPPDS